MESIVAARPFPDFFVIGAQKAGTTALCSILGSHPRVVTCNPKEPNCFDGDDFLGHPAAAVEARDQWWTDWEANRSTVARIYERGFAGAPPDAIKGEGSTTYLPSRKAPRRVAQMVPDAKLVVVLRNPIDRAYSAYWHQVKARVASLPFEAQIKVGPASIIEMGFYREQILNWLRYFSREQMKILIYEKLQKQPGETIVDLLDFLGVGAGIPKDKLAHREHVAMVPRFFAGQLIINHAGLWTGRPVGWRQLVQVPRSGWRRQVDRALDRLTHLNMAERPYPPMAPQVRQRLSDLYRTENHGLDEIVGADVEAIWEMVVGKPRP